MTDKEKLEKIKELADKMYSRMAYLTSETRPIRQAMEEYHQFIINEYHKEEPVSEDLEEGLKAMEYDEPKPNLYRAAEEYVSDQAYELMAFGDDEDFNKLAKLMKQAILYGANWKEQQMMAKAVDARCFGFQGAALFSFRLPADKYLVGSEVKVIVIKED